MYHIYGLHLEGEDEIRYVGSTTQPVKRLYQHTRADGHERVPERIEWVKQNNGRIRMKLLETTSDRRGAEQRWIADLRARGHRLLNRRRATQKYAISREQMRVYLSQLPDDFDPQHG